MAQSCIDCNWTRILVSMSRSHKGVSKDMAPIRDHLSSFVFQKKIDLLLQKNEGVACYVDGIIAIHLRSTCSTCNTLMICNEISGMEQHVEA